MSFIKNLSIIKWFIGGITAIGLAVLLLSILGGALIQEVVQEVSVDDNDMNFFGASIGSLAPHWVLPDLEGNNIALSDFFGEPLAIVFWTSWNIAATDQIRIFDTYQSLDGVKLKVIAINNQENKSAVLNFIQRGKYDVPVVLDELGVVGEQYGIRTLPATYFLDEKGVVRDMVVGMVNKKVLIEKVETLFR